ncbi:long-chain fatty acid CoA synthetase [Fadolivirus algeromassiliense]|jgi:long-chain-fatty-acid--CoA ligase ACSBG|uniref:Long-chain fatty acid CoA synthetase n=1 Tax=Fadolivirus FV1/VV64 TaxID=3070911 RepID=A0A7D3V603_9VIRU|nr:long-chain fatty acid CoA synthetase [Fadolivirus algeromassiliense]QKF94735.1 long-chain fatty acid CoA synthetase [Fadolivirus FV1/VV64]
MNPILQKFTTTNIKDFVNIRRKDDDPIEPKTIVETLFDTMIAYGERPAMVYENDSKWNTITWTQYYNQAKRLASGLIELGLQKGEGVAILGFNSPEWFLSNMAAIMAGGVSVGIYTTNSSETCGFIISDSNSTVVIVENEEYLKKILQIPKEKRSNIKALIQYKGDLTIKDKLVFSWYDFMKISENAARKADYVSGIISNLVANQCSTLIYTSGTTGNPKGVMLSHDNIIWTTKTVLNTIGITSNDPQKIVSYLPLSHVAGQMIDMYMPLVNGGSTWFAKPTALKGTLVDTLKEARPTIFLGVPRVWEKIMEKMKEKGTQLSGIKKYISVKAKEIGIQRHYEMEKGNKEPSIWWDICNSLVYSKVRAELGLDKCKLFLTGAAPISKETLEYFASLNIPIYDVYGMSESSGPISFSYNNNVKLGSSGRQLIRSELKIDALTGEICSRGRHVMMGYLNQLDKTKEAIDRDGWLHTGDIGKLDASGFLHITGRIKELIITAGGENIPPICIEDCVKAELPILSNCMLIGDKKKFLTMLVTLKCLVDQDNVPTDNLDHTSCEILKHIGVKATKVSEVINDKTLHDHITAGIVRANKKSISAAQRIQKFKILPVDFSISGGELGPTLKLKRNVVVDKYLDLIEEMYQEDEK